MLHKLKIKPEYWEAVRKGIKRFEVRKEDNQRYEVGDTVQFEIIGQGMTIMK